MFENKYLLIVLVVIISIILSVVLVLMCEFKTITKRSMQHYYEPEQFEVIEPENKEIIKKFNKKYSTLIDKNLILELFEPYEIYVPIDNIKKDIFLYQNEETIFVKSGVSYKTANKSKIEAFYYDEPYEIFMKKLNK